VTVAGGYTGMCHEHL